MGKTVDLIDLLHLHGDIQATLSKSERAAAEIAKRTLVRAQEISTAAQNTPSPSLANPLLEFTRLFTHIGLALASVTARSLLEGTIAAAEHMVDAIEPPRSRPRPRAVTLGTIESGIH